MEKTIYVIGHRNPDTDSVASAIAYAALKQQLGFSMTVPAIAGEPNPQTRYILDRLGIPVPIYLADVHPKVCDILDRAPVKVGMAFSAYEAIGLFHRSGVRIVPVIDDEGKPLGTLSLLRLSESYLLSGGEQQREIKTNLPALARTLNGRFAAGGEDDTLLTLKLFIGAMLEESFSERIQAHDPGQLLIMTGNRRTIHQAAIEKGVKLLVIT